MPFFVLMDRAAASSPAAETWRTSNFGTRRPHNSRVAADFISPAGKRWAGGQMQPIEKMSHGEPSILEAAGREGQVSVREWVHDIEVNSCVVLFFGASILA